MATLTIMRAEGYGADLELDGPDVVFHLGKARAALTGTDTIRLPLAAVSSAAWRPANAFVNGQVRFDTDWPLPARFDDPAYAPWRSIGGGGMGVKVTRESLVCMWRRKQQPAFDELHRAVMAILDPLLAQRLHS